LLLQNLLLLRKRKLVELFIKKQLVVFSLPQQ
jgi:hypothetical protein